MNKKGLAGIALIGLIVASVVGGTLAATTAMGVAETVKNGQAHKNWDSIKAHAAGLCGEGSTDARCIMK